MDIPTASLADKFGIGQQLVSLDNALMQIPDIVNVEYDIRDYPDIGYIILIPKYDIRPERPDFWEARKLNCQRIAKAFTEHDLHRTEDAWEDMGEHWYIVLKTGKSWPTKEE